MERSLKRFFVFLTFVSLLISACSTSPDTAVETSTDITDSVSSEDVESIFEEEVAEQVSDAFGDLLSGKSVVEMTKVGEKEGNGLGIFRSLVAENSSYGHSGFIPGCSSCIMLTSF